MFFVLVVVGDVVLLPGMVHYSIPVLFRCWYYYIVQSVVDLFVLLYLWPLFLQLLPVFSLIGDGGDWLLIGREANAFCLPYFCSVDTVVPDYSPFAVENFCSFHPSKTPDSCLGFGSRHCVHWWYYSWLLFYCYPFVIVLLILPIRAQESDCCAYAYTHNAFFCAFFLLFPVVHRYSITIPIYLSSSNMRANARFARAWRGGGAAVGIVVIRYSNTTATFGWTHIINIVLLLLKTPKPDVYCLLLLFVERYCVVDGDGPDPIYCYTVLRLTLLPVLTRWLGGSCYYGEPFYYSRRAPAQRAFSFRQ